MGSTRDLVITATATLARAGIESPEAEARLLVALVLETTPGRLVLAPDPTPAQVIRVGALLGQRVSYVPLQHLTGEAPFRHLVLHVGPGVFIPRPETESLVEWGLTVVRGPQRVVDLCAGSGAIAASIATEAPDTEVWAVERDPAALVWLHRNVPPRVSVVAASIFEPLPIDGTVDLVLCNPPYVPIATPVPPEVFYDPRDAVFAGADGLDVIRPLIPRLATMLRPGGSCGVEHDETQDVAALFEADGRFTEVTPRRDLAGRPRFTTATRRAG